MRRWGLMVAGLAILGAVGTADGYRLRSRVIWFPTSSDADRWQESDFPLRFRMLENDNLPADVEIPQAEWTDIVERGLARWTRIPTARIEVELEEATVRKPQANQDDGINTIGFSADEVFVDSWFTAFAAWRWEDDVLVGCDIEVNPDFVKNWAPQDPRELLEVVVIHEMGHCLGLAHTEPHPMPLWTDLPVQADPSFLPDPVMSYSNSYGLELTEDDTVPVSLLYPAPGFLESRGSLIGTLVSSDGPLPFAYVKAVRPGERGIPAGPGPGTFTDHGGIYNLEGLTPGTWMLWFHPILVTRRNAHRGLLEAADEAGSTGFDHFWVWVRVEAGTALEVAAHSGGRATP